VENIYTLIPPPSNGGLFTSQPSLITSPPPILKRSFPLQLLVRKSKSNSALKYQRKMVQPATARGGG